MKKSIILFSFSMVIIVACHTKKEVVKSKTYEPTDAQLTAGKTKYPDLTRDNLITGHSIYYGVCMNCHEAKNINEFSLDEFSSILNKMARKAKLTPEEKDAVLRYAVSIKLSNS
jgi:hypothetical protein